MASANAKKPCAKCNKAGGVATCYGCQEFLCNKHFVEHRQELSMQIDEVGQEHDLLQRDPTRENDAHPLLSRIDEWERESITKIQTVAEAARADLRQSIDRAKNDLKMSVVKITEELQSSRESDDYTEIDLKRWIDQLDELRKKIQTPSTVQIVHENGNASSILLIKMKDEQQLFSTDCRDLPSKQIVSTLQQSNRLSHERFDHAAGNVILSEEGLVAMCSRYRTGISSVICGANSYSSGTHHIRLLIEQKAYYNIFLGIMASSGGLTKRGFPHSAYGWWDLDDSVNGRNQDMNEENIIETGDQVTLTFDCGNQGIQLQHHRSNRLVHLPVDLRACPLPWKLLLQFKSQGDRVRIIT